MIIEVEGNSIADSSQAIEVLNLQDIIVKAMDAIH